jgi:FKBP-type peptidyl-prolyl cis-trans isomerase 2
MPHVSPAKRSLGRATTSTIALLACFATSWILACSNEPTVAPGRNITLEYTLTLEDGTVYENNVGQEPLSIEYGTGQILAVLEEAILGMTAGESKTVQIEPKSGHEISDAARQIPVDKLPEDARRVGAWIAAHDETGAQQMLRVDSINEKTATLKADHPLAGMTLSFYVKVLSIE